MKKYYNAFFLSILLFTAFAFTPPGDDFDYGTVKDNVYTNSYFKCKLNIPEGWVVQSKEQTQQLVETGREVVSGDDQQMKAAIKAAEVNSAYLLTVFQYEVGAPVDFNPSFMIIAENLKAAPGIKTGKDYLFQARKFLKQSQVEYSHIDEEFSPVQIGGKQFYRMETRMNYLGSDIVQQYYSTVLNGFSFNFIISYTTDEQKASLEKTMNTLSFNK